jgi:hypothetical protein
MEMVEYRKHVVASELLKIIQHLNDTRKELIKAVEHIKTIGSTFPETQAIEQNIDALTQGLLETITMSAHARDTVIASMQEPLETPLKNLGSLQIRATSFQKALMREGYKFPSTLPKYVPTKQDARTPHMIPFTLIKRKFRPRHRPGEIPL